MSKASAMILIAVLATCLVTSHPASAQRPVPDVPPVTDGDDGADDLLDRCQDSMFVEAFPMLRTLIDLLSQLLDLLNQADGLLNGGVPSIPSDLPTIPTIPGSDPPEADGTGDLPTGGDLPTIPSSVPTTEALPGGWGIGPILSVQ